MGIQHAHSLLKEQLYAGNVGFEILTALTMIMFFDIISHNQLKVAQCFAGTCSLHFQVRRISRATCFHASNLLGLFDPEDGGDMFLRNIG